MLLIEGVKYELWTPPTEDEFERVVKEHAQDIFGEQSIYLDRKQKLKSRSGIGSIPDGYVVVFGDSPHWHIVEVELSSHPLHEHIVSQVSKFISGIKNPLALAEILGTIYAEITGDDFLKLKVKKATEPTEIYKFLSDLISKQPILTIIIEQDTQGLREALSTLRYPQEIKVVEFQTFTREGVDLAVHAHLFEPLSETPKRGEEPSRGGGERYPFKTSELLAKYGDRPSNVEGVTWQQLYDGNDDGNFRYFKVRIPLIELDKKETQQKEVV